MISHVEVVVYFVITMKYAEQINHKQHKWWEKNKGSS